MRGKKFKKIRVDYLAVALIIGAVSVVPRLKAQAESCPDVRIIFARGSGSPMEGDGNYDSFKNTIEAKLKTTALTYDFINLDYPAIGVNDVGTMLGAYFGAGEAYAFGKSVNDGTRKLQNTVNSSGCSNTKFVLGGYSQGAMVISKSLASLNADKVIFAATFGDPKLYLPEGEGIMPAACRGQNLSDYRMYVPDCQAYKGLLGAYVPYEPESWAGKLGTWCNKMDIMCSSHLSVFDHLAYVADNLYEDASRVIFDKITKTFGLENHISSPHDTAILIDSTGSMSGAIGSYRAEALRLATETLNKGGRVALYDYRDLDDPYMPVEHCSFETCTLEIFAEELDKIKTDGGGDTPESLLSASFHVMKSLKWRYGSTKSVVVLTDAEFLSPDRDEVTFDEVVKLSKSIDPVNFYIITEPENREAYAPLAEATGGRVITSFNDTAELTDYIIARYDSLPRVEETEAILKPTLADWSAVRFAETEIKISFSTDASKVLVAVDDAILGVTAEREITITDYHGGIVTLVPISDDIRGDPVTINISGYGSGIVPKTPNTGRAN
ncbi:cutinase family protein [Candidatus Saccharibacteria bacterium]|nr:cutinase family protein [Candidatus Saccharibacteria bacterium]